MPTDSVDFDREFVELVRELRALPTAAPDELRERVRAIAEPVPHAPPLARGQGVRRSYLQFRPRRALLVLAPVCLLAVVAAAVVHGVLSPSPKPTSSAASQGVRGRARTLPTPARA